MLYKNEAEELLNRICKGFFYQENEYEMNMQWHLKTKQIYQKVSCVNSPADCLSCLFGRRQEWTRINSSATEPSLQSGYKPPTMQSACHLTNLTFTFKQDTWNSHTIICHHHAQLSNIDLESTENDHTGHKKVIFSGSCFLHFLKSYNSFLYQKIIRLGDYEYNFFKDNKLHDCCTVCETKT